MVLTTLIDLNGPAGWVAMLLPMLLLAVVVIGVVVSRDRAPVEAESANISAARAGSTAMPASAPARSPSSTAATEAAPRRTLKAALAAQQATAPASPSVIEEAAAPPFSTTSPTATADASDASAIAVLESQLVQAEKRFDDAAVARYSFELARGIIANQGPSREVQTHLRRAIILATRLKDDATHAAARLELGDLLGKEGDMTSACEHWQIARQIFWDSKQTEPLADVDKRMVANGCPTDWVLNDF